MALRLRRDRSPQWIEVGNGAALWCMPLTSVIVYSAIAAAGQLLVDLKQVGTAVTRLGGSIEGLPDLSDPNNAQGLYNSLLLISTAELVVNDWRNVLDEDGAPLEFDPTLIVHLFENAEVSRNFRARYFDQVEQVNSEGNG